MPTLCEVLISVWFLQQNLRQIQVYTAYLGREGNACRRGSGSVTGEGVLPCKVSPRWVGLHSAGDFQEWYRTCRSESSYPKDKCAGAFTHQFLSVIGCGGREQMSSSSKRKASGKGLRVLAAPPSPTSRQALKCWGDKGRAPRGPPTSLTQRSNKTQNKINNKNSHKQTWLCPYF